jgi:hypothetical protein
MVRMRLLWHIKEIHPEFYYESIKFIRVAYLVTLPNTRQCERIQNQISLNLVLKTHVMILNDLMIMFMSLSLMLLALRLLIVHDWDLKSLILETSLFSMGVHIMANEYKLHSRTISA